MLSHPEAAGHSRLSFQETGLPGASVWVCSCSDTAALNTWSQSESGRELASPSARMRAVGTLSNWEEGDRGVSTVGGGELLCWSWVSGMLGTVPSGSCPGPGAWLWLFGVIAVMNTGLQLQALLPSLPSALPAPAPQPPEPLPTPGPASQPPSLPASCVASQPQALPPSFLCGLV